MKLSDTGKIEAIVYEEGAARGERVELDLDLLAAARRGRDDSREKQLVKAFTIASERGFKWSVVGERVKRLHVYLPGDFKDAVRRFYSE